jgi:hypothetical protein
VAQTGAQPSVNANGAHCRSPLWSHGSRPAETADRSRPVFTDAQVQAGSHAQSGHWIDAVVQGGSHPKSIFPKIGQLERHLVIGSPSDVANTQGQVLI